MFWLSNRQHLATPLIAPLRVRAHGTHRIQSSSAASGSGMAFSPQRGVTGWRGGQDLTHRDVRLSRALRQEQAFERVGLVAKGAAEGARSEGAMAGAGETQARPRTFRGMVIPQKPRPPESDGASYAQSTRCIPESCAECCMSGKCHGRLTRHPLSNITNSLCRLCGVRV